MNVLRSNAASGRLENADASPTLKQTIRPADLGDLQQLNMLAAVLQTMHSPLGNNHTSS